MFFEVAAIPAIDLKRLPYHHCCYWWRLNRHWCQRYNRSVGVCVGVRL